MRITLYLLMLICILPIIYAGNVSVSTPIELYKSGENFTLYFEGGYYSLNLSEFEITNFTTNITFNRYFENETICDLENITLWREFKKMVDESIDIKSTNTALSLKLMSCEESLNPLCYNKSSALDTCENLRTILSTEKDSYLTMYNNCSSYYPKELESAKSNNWLYLGGGILVMIVGYFIYLNSKKVRWGRWKKDLPGMGEPGRTTKIPLTKIPLDKL